MDRYMYIKELFAMYKKWVINNPNVVTDMETVATWSSYFVSGKINKSPIVSELVYSVSKLISLFNDRILKEAYGNEEHYYGLREQIKLWLTIVHYLEVFVELTVKKKWGTQGKWAAATIIQLFKSSSALVLLYRFKELPLKHPPIPFLQRAKLTNDKDTDDNSNGYFKLKRSGRVLRRVEGAPPVAFRDWQPLQVKDDTTNSKIEVKDLIYAESLHILKPLVHLLAMRTFGTKAWKQWLVALGMDFASMKLYNKHLNELTNDQKTELSRRKLGLVLYLLRNPMYNGYSKNVIESTLVSLSNKIPLTGYICNPIIQYLSHWQEIYFYMWAA